jgi:hypothetical protein
MKIARIVPKWIYIVLEGEKLVQRAFSTFIGSETALDKYVDNLTL